jgi:hypothetical protein
MLPGEPPSNSKSVDARRFAADIFAFVVKFGISANDIRDTVDAFPLIRTTLKVWFDVRL